MPSDDRDTERARAECWDGGPYSYIVTVDGRPTGPEVWKDDAVKIANWLNRGGLAELERHRAPLTNGG